MHSISGSTTMVEAPADSSKQPDPRIINNSNTLSNISTTTPSGDTSSRTSGNATDTPRNARNSRLDPPAKISTSTEINSETSVQPPHAVDATEGKQVIESSSPSNSRPVSPTDQDSDENPENASDLQFKKKDFHKSRTQSFQSVLSSASLKSLRHQFTIPSQPQLKRNPSTISQSNTKNFQSFIQAPVLSSVTNLRTTDDVEIGQRLPFDQKLNSGLDFNDKRSRRNSLLESAGGDAGGKGFEKDDDEEDSEDDEDNYKEETTLQQQRLTLNALKKLSLSLAPIIRSDDDEQGPQSRQLTTKSLNSSKQEGRVRDLRPVLRSTSSKKSKPYQPAEVDLSSFSSLTRQSKHNNDTGAPPQVAAGPQDGRVRTDSQIMQPSQAQVERAAHSQAQTQTQSHSQPQNHLQQSSTQTHTSSQSATVSQTRTQTQGLMEHNVSETSNTPAQMPTPRSGSSDMRNTGFEKNLNPNAHSQNKSLFVGNQLTRKAESQFPEVNSKMVSNSMTGAGKSSSNSSESQVSSSRNSSNLMRPTQLSTNFHQRDSTGRIQGPVPETSHGSSFGSSKSHGSDKRLQQINGFRSPMYIPAVLRKNVDEMLELGADADGHGEHHGDKQ
ncbi:hypothetical protein JCM33374_g2892 [Metschnikowia sp. JCM 33374]|nr:hypothetical protein JCM33374_g2892 [Metschnikowia sp. JCM 33374]